MSTGWASAADEVTIKNRRTKILDFIVFRLVSGTKIGRFLLTAAEKRKTTALIGERPFFT
jgi:hypothetical protein